MMRHIYALPLHMVIILMLALLIVWARTLIDVDNKKIIVVTLDTQQPDETIVRDIARKLKVSKASNISVLQVDKDGNSVQDQQNWVAHLA